MPSNLLWSVGKYLDGSFVRRKAENDTLGLDYVDVSWTLAGGRSFPPDSVMVPVTHPPDIRYARKEVGRREVVKDQVIVSPDTSDGTIAIILDGKRKALAAALGVDP